MKIPEYELKRSDRAKRVGGGVLLYAHENIPFSYTARYDDSTCEVLFCKFDTIKTCVVVVYRPTDAPLASFKKAMDFIYAEVDNVGDDSFNICITGDFNFPDIDWEFPVVPVESVSEEQHSKDTLFKLMSDLMLNQYVDSPTRENNILDLFFTNNGHLVTNVTTSDSDLSDHDLVDISVSSNFLDPNLLKPTRKTFNEESFRSLDFRRANFEEIREELRKVDWAQLRTSCSFEEFPKLFTETLYNICVSLVPMKKASTGKPKAFHALQRKKKRLFARLEAVSKFGNSNHAQALKRKLALVSYDLKEAIANNADYQELKAVKKIKANPKFFYSYAKSFSQTKTSISMLVKGDKVITDKTEIANTLQEQFSSVYSDPSSPNIKSPDFIPPNITHPLLDEDFVIEDDDILQAISEILSNSACGPDGIPAILLKQCKLELCKPINLIWSESFQSGVVPKFYKASYVTPIYKKGSRAIAVNYRPVSLTSHVMKIYERILRKKIVSFLEANRILCPNQHGFRSGRSCLTQMLSHFDDVLSSLTNNADTDAIYLDYAKAFDKVDHNLLIAKLRLYGFNKCLIKWIESFLTNRTQSVVVDGHQSLLALIKSGVPQGTVLGPILFILFINDLEKCIKHSTSRFFADDTRISKQIQSVENVAELQEDLNRVIQWSQHNNMVLHEDKFQLLIHRHDPKHSLIQLPFLNEFGSYKLPNGDTLFPVDQLKDLGIIVSPNLSWTAHINDISSRAKNIASWVFSVFKTREADVMCQLYKSLVRSHLEYCCPLWNPADKTGIQSLEEVQRSFTAKIWKVNHLNYWDRLKALKLMSLQRRRERYITIQMWKILNDHCPNDLNVRFMAPSRRGIRSVVPPLNRQSSRRNQSLYDNSFAVLGPRLWNILPANMTEISEKEAFKHQLTKFMLSFPDEPPVAGYSRANGNSMIDWCSGEADRMLLGRSDYVMAQ